MYVVAKKLENHGKIEEHFYASNRFNDVSIYDI